MKRLPAKKAYLIFYAFDIILLLIVGLFLLPFSKGKNIPDFQNGEFLAPKEREALTEIRIIDRKAMFSITMTKDGDRWIGTDSNSNNTFFWPCDSRTVENFINEMTATTKWTKKASNVTSWKKLGVDSGNAVEVDFRSQSKTITSVFFGSGDHLSGEVYFRTAENSTVWQSKTAADVFLYDKTASFWADPYLVPLCASGLTSKEGDSELRRGELAYIRPGDHVKPVKVIKKFFDSGMSAIYSFYEKEDQIVVIPEFSGNDYLSKLNYRFTISRWTYDKFIRELEK